MDDFAACPIGRFAAEDILRLWKKPCPHSVSGARSRGCCSYFFLVASYRALFSAFGG